MTRFVLGFGIGVFFFVFPIEWQGQTTIPLDVVITVITENFTSYAEFLTLHLVLSGGALTTLSLLHYRGSVTLNQECVERLELDYWETSTFFWICRVVGILLALPIATILTHAAVLVGLLP